LQFAANLGLSRWLYSPDKEIRSLSNGSLGCINTPPGTMAEVYQLVEVGMPVIIF